MAEIWVWFSPRCAKESAELLSLVRELVLPDEELWAVAVQEQGGLSLPPVTGLRRCPTEGSESYKAHILCEMAEKYKPEIILFPVGFETAHIAASAAALLDTGLSADCTTLRRENGLLIMHRPAFGGGVVADIVCREKRPQMATVRSGALPRLPFEAIPAKEQLYSPKKPHSDRVELLEAISVASEKSIRDAGIIVAGGLGVGSADGFALLAELAGKMGAMLGASRAAVDAGFAPWRCQVGQTGSTVHPDLYLAFGISGSIQHVAGMHSAAYVAAVNTDKRAPIFDYADLAVVADWRSTAEFLINNI